MEEVFNKLSIAGQPPPALVMRFLDYDDIATLYPKIKHDDGLKKLVKAELKERRQKYVVNISN